MERQNDFFGAEKVIRSGTGYGVGICVEIEIQSASVQDVSVYAAGGQRVNFSSAACPGKRFGEIKLMNKQNK